MENATQRTTSKDNAAIHREMAELQEHQGWVHHVADAATGKVLTTQLDHSGDKNAMRGVDSQASIKCVCMIQSACAMWACSLG